MLPLTLHHLFLFIHLIFNVTEAAQTHKRIDVPPILAAELNLVLSGADNYHQALISSDERAIELTAIQLKKRLSAASLRVDLALNQAPHLAKMLATATTFLEMSLSLTGESRSDSRRELLRELVQIAQVYNLDKYNVFYCKDNNVVWLQKAKVPINPIETARFKSCGRMVE